MDTALPFLPERAFIQEEALAYELGLRLDRRLRALGAQVTVLKPRGRVSIGSIPGGTAAAYRAAKRTMVVAVRRTLDFQTCRPSADYQLPLVTSCPATCAYCYLQTTLGPRPYVRVYVNVGEILDRAGRYAAARRPEIASFEAAATGDPLAVEPLTGSLAEAVSFAAGNDAVLLRSVSKFSLAPSLLRLCHAGKTRLRWSLNTPEIIRRWERGTVPLDERVSSAIRAAAAGYPVGFMVAPVFAAAGWEDQYTAMFARLREATRGAEFPRGADGKALTFEVVTHRFTRRAKDLILKRHAQAGLPLEEGDRRYRRGQFGYGKYVYPREVLDRVRDLMTELVHGHFPGATLEYVV